MEVGSETPLLLAAYLGMLGADFEVVEPPELVEQLRVLADHYAARAPVEGQKRALRSRCECPARRKTTAAAAATFNESTPARIGIATRRSASAVHRADRPAPSDRARRRPDRRTEPPPTDRILARCQGDDLEPSLPQAYEAVVPVSSARTAAGTRSPSTPSARRYSGSAHRGLSRTASMPNAAAHRKTAPTLVWSTRSSSTTTRRASHRPCATLGNGRRSSGGQCSPVHVEAGHGLDQLRRRHVAGRVRRPVEHVGQRVQPARRHQQRSHPVPGLDRPPHDLRPRPGTDRAPPPSRFGAPRRADPRSRPAGVGRVGHALDPSHGGPVRQSASSRTTS